MARAFDINSSTSRIEIKDTSPKGQVTFTVTNRLGRQVEVQAMVVPDDPKRAAWYRIGTDHKTLAADQTDNFDVAVAVPQGAAPGDYSFKLVAANVASPDDESTEGPAVSVHYLQEPNGNRKFKWWLVPVIVGALAVIALVIWLVIPDGPKVGTACVKKEDCGANQKCTALPGGQQACLLKPQEKCSKDVDCSSFWCVDGKKCSRDDGKCESDAECRPPSFACINNLCLKKIGESCSAPTDCTTGNCAGGKCAPSFEACTPACVRGFVCSHGTCLRVVAPDTFRFELKEALPLRRLFPQ